MGQKTNKQAERLQRELESLIVSETQGSMIDSQVVKNLIRQESQWNVNAVSHTGNRGLLQITGNTVKEIVKKHRVKVVGSPLQPKNQVKLGVTYLKWLNSQVVAQWPEMTIKQQTGVTLHCYNSGLTATKKAIAKGGVTGFFKYLPKVNDKDYAAKILGDAQWMMPQRVAISRELYDAAHHTPLVVGLMLILVFRLVVNKGRELITQG